MSRKTSGNDSSTVEITATLVPENERMGFLPACFGMRWMMLGEISIFRWMEVLSRDCRGGLW